MNQIYQALGTSKQNVHQRLERHLNHLEEGEQLRLVIQQVRQDHPTMGARSLYQKLKPQTMGRDRFFNWYYAQGFTVRPLKNWRRTTDSCGVIRFENLIQDITLTGINQGWVSDITYYDIKDRFYYLTFVMDLYSRKIKGYHASQSLHTEHTTIPALEMAMKDLTRAHRPVFHSDGGGQYYSKIFLELTKDRLINSMGKSAYENPHAERLNRTIKNGYLRFYNPDNFDTLKINLAKAVKMYNDGKPHRALNGRTPSEFEQLNKC